jgi:DNA-binding winged helix-turn-helix (wHTH) protein
MPGQTAGPVFCFGAFEANVAGGELRKRGVRVKLHSQPFQVLVMLLERPSEVVTREEMRQRLWGADTFVDFDHGLNSAVNKIREALDDSASQPRYIETVSGKGYRFVAPVTLRAPAAPEPVKLAAAPGEASAARERSAAPSPAGPFDAPLYTVLAATDDLPAASRNLVRTLLLLVQVMYLAFYLVALANLPEIHEVFVRAGLLPPAVLMALVVTTAAVLIPVRLFILAAAAFAAARPGMGIVAFSPGSAHQHGPGLGDERGAGVHAIRPTLADSDVRARQVIPVISARVHAEIVREPAGLPWSSVCQVSVWNARKTAIHWFCAGR